MGRLSNRVGLETTQWVGSAAGWGLKPLNRRAQQRGGVRDNSMAGLSSRVRGRNNPVGGLSSRRGVEIAQRVGSVTGWAQLQGGEDRKKTQQIVSQDNRNHSV